MNRRPPREVDALLLDFQSVMAQFLDTQQHVLATYFSGMAGAAPGPAAAVDGDPAGVAPPAPFGFAGVPAAPSAVGAAPASSAAPALVDLPAVPAPNPVPAVSAAAAPAPAALEHVPPTPQVASVADEWSAAKRLLIRAMPRYREGRSAGLAAGHGVVITDDGAGLGEALARRLRAEGRRVVLLRCAPADHADPDTVVVPFDSATALAQAADTIIAAGPIAALVHLWPLAPGPAFETLDVPACMDRLRLEVRSLFVLAQALGPALLGAHAAGGAAVIAATAMGGAFATAELPAGGFSPGHGGVTGLMKCLALEWPSIRVRSVDLDPVEAAEAHATFLFDELGTVDDQVEIGFCRGRRLGLEVYEAPPLAAADFTLSSDAIVLATGGARGITAEICRELAERYQPTFVLVGQTSLPDSIEPADTASLTAPGDLKRALMARLGRDGTKVTAPLVERAYHQLLREREMRDNVGALTAVGARVHYVRLDVRDDDALAAMITDIYQTYGRLDGIVHGAGIIEDKLVQQKSIESFDRVFETKTRSACALARSIRPETLRFAVFFSSVAGRFGNRGQADYAAANEVVNKLAIRLNQIWPVRVSSIAWAPWDKRGMVSPELKREFAARGVELLHPIAGRRAFWDEIQQPRGDAAEVVVASSANASLAPGSPALAEPTPLLRAIAPGRGEGGAVVWRRTIDPVVDLYLDDHRLDGKGVLPLAFATELMAEAAQKTWPDLTVAAVRNLQLFRGIVVGDEPVALEINVRAPVHTTDSLETQADVEIVVPGTTPLVRYRATVDLTYRLDAPAEYDGDTGLSLPPMAPTLAAAYAAWTFHGPLFRRLTSVAGLGVARIRCGICSSSGAVGVRGVARAAWIIDPYVFDAALQMLLIWSRAHHDKTALPSRFRAFRRYGSLSDRPLTVHLRVESLAGGHAIRSDVHFVGPDGLVVAVLEGMEASCSAELNRLTGA